MGKEAWVVAWGWFAVGCCTNGRYPSDLKGGIHVRQDEFVDSWRVNGEKVCAREIRATPGCYLLEVEYGASYSRQHGDMNALVFVSPVAAVIGFEASRTRASYESGRVPFALRVRYPNSYYVTATFTGDQFLPRIIESNAAGERLGQIDPARSDQELADCKAGKPATPPALKTAAEPRASVTWRPSNISRPKTCD
jgi:hypothetical protein